MEDGLGEYRSGGEWRAVESWDGPGLGHGHRPPSGRLVTLNTDYHSLALWATGHNSLLQATALY